MTLITLLFCFAILTAAAVGVAVLPWSDHALDASQASWVALWNHLTQRVVSPAPVWSVLVSEPGVSPPYGPTVWAPPLPQQRCARVA